MAICVVDTDVWSYIYKDRDEGKLYQPHLLGNILLISFQTQAELMRWAISAGWGQRQRQHLESRLEHYVVEHSSYALSLRWAEAMESARRQGRPITPADAWTAATALHLDAPLITHNKNDFVGVEGLRVTSESNFEKRAGSNKPLQ